MLFANSWRLQEFKVRGFQVGPANYFPLPKLPPQHMARLRDGLLSRGFKVNDGKVMVARGGAQTIRIYPTGYCRSDSDPTDAIVPLIPTLLAIPQTGLGLSEFMGLYLSTSAARGRRAVRFNARLELGLWKSLRAAGDCALTPDEHSFAADVIGSSKDDVQLVTDFPNETSIPMRLGGKWYYRTTLSPSEASSTLRSIDSGASRNSYLPRDGIVTIRGSHPIREETFQGLGQWSCYALSGKSSNPRGRRPLQPR